MLNESSPKRARLGRTGPGRLSSVMQFLFLGSLPLEHETCLFLLVNLADFLLTAWLTHAGGFREANQLAVWVLQNWGWQGLLVYKFGLVTVICLLAQVIACQRPETARRLLNGATVLFALMLAGAVVLAVVA